MDNIPSSPAELTGLEINELLQSNLQEIQGFQASNARNENWLSVDLRLVPESRGGLDMGTEETNAIKEHVLGVLRLQLNGIEERQSEPEEGVVYTYWVFHTFPGGDAFVTEKRYQESPDSKPVLQWAQVTKDIPEGYKRLLNQSLTDATNRTAQSVTEQTDPVEAGDVRKPGRSKRLGRWLLESGLKTASTLSNPNKYKK